MLEVNSFNSYFCLLACNLMFYKISVIVAFQFKPESYRYVLFFGFQKLFANDFYANKYPTLNPYLSPYKAPWFQCIQLHYSTLSHAHRIFLLRLKYVLQCCITFLLWLLRPYFASKRWKRSAPNDINSQPVPIYVGKRW